MGNEFDENIFETEESEKTKQFEKEFQDMVNMIDEVESENQIQEETNPDSEIVVEPVKEDTEENAEANTEEKTVAPKEKTGGKGLKILLIIFILIFLGTLLSLVLARINQKNANKAYQELANNTNVQETTSASETEDAVTEDPEQADGDGLEIPDKAIDWADLRNQNDDVYAWIYIPGTNVDYPVVSPADDEDPNFYLDHNFDKSYGPYPGCIYSLPIYNKTDFSDFNLILYGHNMKDGSMFETLHSYSEQSFLDENKFIYVYTEKANYKYQIFAAYETDNQQIFKKYNFSSEFGYMNYLDEILNQRNINSVFSQEVAPTSSDKIITLSTCISGKGDSRWLVQGVMLGTE